MSVSRPRTRRRRARRRGQSAPPASQPAKRTHSPSGVQARGLLVRRRLGQAPLVRPVGVDDVELARRARASAEEARAVVVAGADEGDPLPVGRPARGRAVGMRSSPRRRRVAGRRPPRLAPARPGRVGDPVAVRARDADACRPMLDRRALPVPFGQIRSSPHWEPRRRCGQVVKMIRPAGVHCGCTSTSSSSSAGAARCRRVPSRRSPRPRPRPDVSACSCRRSGPLRTTGLRSSASTPPPDGVFVRFVPLARRDVLDVDVPARRRPPAREESVGAGEWLVAARPRRRRRRTRSGAGPGRAERGSPHADPESSQALDLVLAAARARPRREVVDASPRRRCRCRRRTRWPDRLGHPAHLPVSPLVEDELEPGRVEPPHAGRRGRAVLELDALGELRERVVRRLRPSSRPRRPSRRRSVGARAGARAGRRS